MTKEKENKRDQKLEVKKEEATQGKTHPCIAPTLLVMGDLNLYRTTETRNHIE
jgi:hypothetical protein